MKPGDWITLAAVIVALGLGLASLLQTQFLQKRERKERLLNEIIDWATDISKHGAELNFILLAAQIDEEPWGKLDIPTIQSDLRDLMQRCDYILYITGNNDSLILAANKIKEEVVWFLNSMDNLFIKIRLEGAIESLPTIFKSMIEHDSLVGYANELLKEAVKVKLKGIH